MNSAIHTVIPLIHNMGFHYIGVLDAMMKGDTFIQAL